MAGLSPEMQFLQSLQGDSEYTPQAVDSEQAYAPAEDDEDDYDPSSFVSGNKPQGHSASSTPALQQQPILKGGKSSRFKGGFEIDEDEDEDSTERPNSTTGNGAYNISGPVNPTSSISTAQAAQTAQTSKLSLSTPSYIDTRTSVTPTLDKSALPSNLARPSIEEPSSAVAPLFRRARLPEDRVGMLEDRIMEDPRGDVDAWLELITEHRNHSNFDQAREVYQRFFRLYPTAVTPLVSYAKMEQELNEVARLEKIFQDHLMNVPDVNFWAMYLNHVRRHQVLTLDTTGTARATVSQAFKIVLDHLGIDKDAGSIWRDYIQFLQSAPGTLGGQTAEDMQKMDALRAAFKQAVTVPSQELQAFWKDYHTFEHSVNQLHARKFLNELGAAFMDAKQAFVQLQNITEKLDRTSVPRLPPAPGFEGDTEHQEQVEIWRRWIAWELNDPLLLKKDNPLEYQKRILYVLKQATIWQRFEPDFWFEGADFCFKNGLDAKGDEFLDQGIVANPESCLLAFKKGDRLELSPFQSEQQEDDMSRKRRGDMIRKPFDRVIAALFDLDKLNETRKEKSISRIRENNAHRLSQLEQTLNSEEELEQARKTLDMEQDHQIKAIEAARTRQVELFKNSNTHAWIAMMRTLRRVQGKGKPDKTDSPNYIAGLRGTFTEGRKKGSVTGDFYSASAWMEHNCYREQAASKIFQKGSQLFPLDNRIAREHIKYLLTAVGDWTNARVIFATAVRNLTVSKETMHKAKGLFVFFHDYESKFGELSQVQQLEKRMAELFPEDPTLYNFSSRFKIGDPEDTFDPTHARPIISVLAQMRPKLLLPLPPISSTPNLNTERAAFSPRPSASPRPALGLVENLARNSPKRPFLGDHLDDSLNPRKIARGESPLKGAAGRRLDAAKRRAEGGSQQLQITPQPLPADINFLLMALPKQELCNNITRTNIPALMSAIAGANVEGSAGVNQVLSGYSQMPMSYGYPPR